MPPSATPDRPRGPHDHFLVAADGVGIHYLFRRGSDSKAPVLIVHGAGEYAERYQPFMDFLNEAGYPVAAIDLRGFGQSGGPRAFVRRFDEYLNDVSAVANQVMRSAGAERLHLMGHSMGGLVAAAAAAQNIPAGLSSLTLSSPCFALSFQVPPHLRAIGAVCSVLTPQKLFPTQAISEVLTHDPRIAREHKEDPRIVHFMSARLFFEMHAQMRDFYRLAKRVAVPTAIFQAGDDRVVDRRASRKFFDALAVSDKRWTLYDNGFHEILNETFRSNVYRDILAFLGSVHT